MCEWDGPYCYKFVNVIEDLFKPQEDHPIEKLAFLTEESATKHILSLGYSEGEPTKFFRMFSSIGKTSFVLVPHPLTEQAKAKLELI